MRKSTPENANVSAERPPIINATRGHCLNLGTACECKDSGKQYTWNEEAILFLLGCEHKVFLGIVDRI